MATTVGQHSVAAFTSPSNGDALDATVVKGNDNTLRSAYVDHDADTGIHLQSSTLAARPAAGVAGRKWLTTDTGSITVWYDNGSTWEATAADLSNLNASNLTSGTVPNARFPATLPAASGTNLTNLNASNLSSGTIPDARFPAVLPAVSAVNLTNIPAGSASTLTGSTLASGVTASSLTSVGTLTSLTTSGQVNLQDNVLLRPRIQDYGEVRTTPSISSGTLTLNLENGNVFGVSLNASITTLTIQNPSASGTACSFTLALTADGTARTVTWGASVKWASGTAPTLTSTNGKVDIFTFVTWDAGSNWYGFTSGQNF